MRLKNFAWPFKTVSEKTGLGAWYSLTLICLNFLSLPVAAQSNNFVYAWTTLAGYPFISTADGVGSNARFKSPQGVAVDGEGNAYIADQQNNTIRMVTLSGVVTTIAGLPGYAGKSDGIGNNALFKNPVGVAVDSAGNVYVTDNGNATIRMLTPEAGTTNWSVTTIAGLAGRTGSVDGTNTHARFYSPYGIAVDGASNLYVADYQENTIRKITPSGTNWVVSTIAGLAGSSDSTAGHTDGTNSAARFFQPEYVAVDINTNLYVADSNNHSIRKITPSGTNWVTSTLAGLVGSPGSADGMGTNAQFDFPCGIGLDAAGNVYVADDGNELIRKITPLGIVNTLAGLAGHYGSADGTGTNALFYDPAGLVVDGSGNMLVADSANDEIRKVTLAGVTSTLAGLPLGESAGSTDGIGSEARFNRPYGMAVDANGNVYVADTYNSTIRQITSAGLVTTIAGLAGSSGTNDGVGSYARFNQPYDVAVDFNGNVFVADYGNYTVREITAAGVVSTIAGLPTQEDRPH